MKSEKKEIDFECFLYVHHFEIQQECPIVPESHGYNFKNKKEYQKIKGNTKNTAGQQLLVMDTASGKSVLLFRDETKDYKDNG